MKSARCQPIRRMNPGPAERAAAAREQFAAPTVPEGRRVARRWNAPVRAAGAAAVAPPGPRPFQEQAERVAPPGPKPFQEQAEQVAPPGPRPLQEQAERV